MRGLASARLLSYVTAAECTAGVASLSMRALVTGMTGFVGRHLTESLLGSRVEVHGTFLPAAREPEIEGAEGYGVDITDPAAVHALMAHVRPDAIFHLAGASSVSHSFADPEGTWQVNVEGTRCMLNAMHRAVPDARMVIALSGDEYGDVPADALPVTEATPLNPVSPYARSKVAADELCLKYQREYRLAVLRLRAFNQVGPGQDTRFVLPSICKQIADSEASDSECILRLGNIDVSRDFVDVRDVVAAYRIVVERGDPARAYLAGSGSSCSVRSLLNIVVAQALVPVRIQSDPTRVREGEPRNVYASPEALRALGWETLIPLERSLTDTLRYWRIRAHSEVD